MLKNNGLIAFFATQLKVFTNYACELLYLHISLLTILFVTLVIELVELFKFYHPTFKFSQILPQILRLMKWQNLLSYESWVTKMEHKMVGWQNSEN